MSVLPTNGTLTRIDPTAAPTSGGDEAWTTGSAIDVAVTIDEPTRAQQVKLGATLAQVQAVIYVLKNDLPEGTQILEGYKVVAAQEGESAQTYRVIERSLRVFGELTHYELFCKQL